MMTDAEALAWAQRAFAELAAECEEIARLPIVSDAEAHAWRSIAEKAHTFSRVLEKTRPAPSSPGRSHVEEAQKER